MLNLLTLTATEAQQLLQAGSTTSVKLVETYLDQIERHNRNGLQSLGQSLLRGLIN